MLGELGDLLVAELDLLADLLAELVGLVHHGALRLLEALEGGRIGTGRRGGVFQTLEAVFHLVHLAADENLADSLDLLRRVQG